MIINNIAFSNDDLHYLPTTFLCEEQTVSVHNRPSESILHAAMRHITSRKASMYVWPVCDRHFCAIRLQNDRSNRRMLTADDDNYGTLNN